MSRNERGNSFGPIGPADVGPTTTNNDEQEPTTDNRQPRTDNRRVTSDARRRSAQGQTRMTRSTGSTGPSRPTTHDLRTTLRPATTHAMRQRPTLIKPTPSAREKGLATAHACRAAPKRTVTVSPRPSAPASSDTSA
ncbi:hypothetical protein E2R25_04270 [Burkholderia pseudomallei]|nr:hypothetical protein EXY72_04215 [Burkholderia pseudomallei]QBP67543.1 hypothetical protein E2R25_04270 [Burkholderia pseudomallei]